MTWVIGGITLPRDPTTIEEKNPSNIKAYDFPSELPLLMVLGNKARVLVLEGLFQKATKTKANLETDYIIPLRGKIGTEVIVAGPDTRYDGTWILNAFNFREEPGIVRAFRYHMELWIGYQHVVI